MKTIKEQLKSSLSFICICMLFSSLFSCNSGDKNNQYVNDAIEINGTAFKNGNIDYFLTDMKNVKTDNEDLVYQFNNLSEISLRSKAKSKGSTWEILKNDKLQESIETNDLDITLEPGFYKVQLKNTSNSPYVLVNVKEEQKEEQKEVEEVSEEQVEIADNIESKENNFNTSVSTTNSVTSYQNPNSNSSSFNSTTSSNATVSNVNLDSDRDRIPDAEEIRNGTNKNNPCDPNPNAIANGDCDNDGLSNYNEEIKYNTDPLNRDTDGDGLSDYDEVKKYKTNPLVKNSTPSSTTNTVASKPSSSKPTYSKPTTSTSGPNTSVSSKPAIKDIDGDGLSDDEEIALGTDKRLKDTDGDKLSDYDEIKKHKTNPKKTDSDFDGHSDFEEVTKGTDPNNKLDPLDVEADFFPDRPLYVGIQRNGNCAANGEAKESSEIRVKITTDKKCVLSGCYIKLEEKAYLNVELQDDLGLKISSIKKQLVLKGEQQIPLRDIKETLKPGKNYFLTVKSENGANLKFIDGSKCKESYTNKGVTIKNTFENKGLFDFKFLY